MGVPARVGGGIEDIHRSGLGGAGAPVLPNKPSGAEALLGIITHCLDHLLANVAATRAGESTGEAVEAVHQMRIAIRRARAALVLFGPMLKPQATARHEAELRRIGRLLGDARDWDVFCTEILPRTLSDTSDAGWRDLLATHAAERRAAARQCVLDELDTPRLTGLVRGLAGWAEATRTGAVHGAPLAGRFASAVPALLDKLADKVDRRGRHIGRRSGAELHTLRKSLKKLRYGIEFVDDALPGKHRKSYSKQVRTLQKTLGEVNDAATARQLAESLAEGPHADLAQGVALLTQRLAPAQTKARHRLAKVWRAYRAEGRWWD